MNRYLDAVSAYFRARPGQWIDGMELAKVGGCYAYRTRISDCRTQLGMCVENRLRKVGERTVSEYCYRPAVVPVQAGLWEEAR